MTRGRTKSDFTEGTKRILAKRVGERCSRPNCPNVTSAPHTDPAKALNVGKAAHIYAASDNGPRGNPDLTPEERRHPTNGIWFCGTCHDIVDGDPLKYPATLLEQWKEEAENRQQRRLLEHPSELVDYWLSEVEWGESLLDEFRPQTCLEHLDRSQPRFWEKANEELKEKTLRLRARALLRLHKFEEAADFFALSAAISPDSLQSKCDLAHSHYLLERPVEAENTAREALLIDPEKGRAQGIVIASQAAQNDYADILKDLPCEWKSSWDVAYALGTCALRQSHFDEALLWFEKAKSLNPEVNVDILQHYAHALFRKVESAAPMFPGRPLTTEERALLEKAASMLCEAWDIVSETEVAKLHLPSLSNAVIILFALGDYKTGTRLVDEGLLEDPNDESLVKHKALLLLESGKSLQGEAFLRDTLSRKDNPFVIGMLAMCLLNKGETEEIQGLLDRLFTFELDPDEREKAVAIQLLCYLNTNNVESAEGLLEELSDDERKKPIFQIYEARVLLTSGSKEAATDLLRSIASEANEWPPIQQLDFADTCHRAGLFQEAILFFSKNVSLEQDSSTLRKLLECHVRVGEKNKAFEIARNLREKLGALHLVTRYEASIYEEIGDLPNCAAVLQLYREKFPDDHEVKLWLADILLRLGRTAEADAILAENLNWETLSADHICYLAQVLSRRGRSTDALNILYAARRQQDLRRSSFRIHMGYIVTFMNAEEKEHFNVSEVGPGTSVRFSDSEDRRWRTILQADETPLGECELLPDSPLAERLNGKKVGDKVILKESPYSKDEVTIAEIQSNYVRAFQEVFENYEEWFGSDAGLWGIKLPKLEDGNFDFDPIFKSAIERESHAHEVLSLYKNGRLSQSLFAQLLGGHFLSAWAYLTSNAEVGVRFTTSGPVESAAESELLSKDGVRLVVDLSALLTIRCLDIGSEITKIFGKPLISQAVLDEISMARNKEEMLGVKDHLSVSSEQGKMVGHEVPKEVSEHNIASLKDFDNWVRGFCEVTPIPRLLTDLKDKSQKLESAVGEMEAHSLVLAASPDNILYSDDLLIRNLGKGELSLRSVCTESVLLRLRASKEIDEAKHQSKLLQLFELNYRALTISPELILPAASQSQWTIKGPFEAVCSSLRSGNYDRPSLINVIAQSLLEISNSQASETQKVQLSCHLLNSICSESNASNTANAIISLITNRSKLYIPSDQRLIELVNLWLATRFPNKS